MPLCRSTEAIPCRLFWQLCFPEYFRYAIRQLRHSPGFALTAIVTLALGIGANVIVFSVLNSLVLHPLHFPDANRLYTVQHTQQGEISLSYPDYKDLRDRNTTFSDLALFHFSRFGLQTKDGTQAVWGNEVSGNYFGCWEFVLRWVASLGHPMTRTLEPAHTWC